MRAERPGPVAPRVSDQDRAVVYLSILVALFLAALDQTIVATALPRMVEDLQGVERYAWVVTAYLLTSTSFALLYGKLADTYPRKLVTLGAIGLFLTGSILSGLSGIAGSLPLLGDGMTQLVLFRGLQGIGGGGLFAMTFIVIADLFTPAERGRYQGFVGAVFGIASVLGPVVGGMLTDHAGGLIPGVAGWRWVFLVNVPVGGAALWFIIRRMPRLEPHGRPEPVDLGGAALLVGGLVPLILGLQIDKRAHPWFPPGSGASGASAWLTPALVLLGAALLAAFVARARTVRGAILDLGLFREPVFRRANAASFFVGAAFMSITIFLPLFLVNVSGVSATRAGAALIPFSLGLVFSATTAGQLANRLGYRRQIVGGLGVFLIATLLLSRMDADVPYALVTLYMILCGIGVGPGMPLFTLAIQNAADVRRIGQATSASQFFRQMGATVGAALMGTVLAFTLSGALATLQEEVTVATRGEVVVEDFLDTGGVGLAEAVDASLERRVAAEPPGPQSQAMLASGRAFADQIRTEVRDAFVLSTNRIYALATAISLIALLLSARIPEVPLRTTHDREVVTREDWQEGGGPDSL